MNRVAIVGGGHIGEMMSELLLSSGDYTVTVFDQSADALARLGFRAGLTTRQLDVMNGEELRKELQGHFAVISAAPYHVTTRIAQAAHDIGIHYLDLTEDVASTKLVKSLAATSRSALIPQCGLAPGFISIVGMDLAQRLDKLDTLRLRVGALPQFPSNALGYNLTWSTAGVINEYLQPCEAIVGGKLVSTSPLEELEHFALDGVAYEAFNTSGGLGTLCETLDGNVRSLNYRTIRYPGHRDVMKLLLQDLRLSERPEVLRDVLEHAIPGTSQDVVVIFVTATGTKNGRPWQESYANRVYARESNGRVWTAIQITTASAACTVLDLLREGKLPQQGLVRQEQIPLAAFLANRFGKAYAQSVVSGAPLANAPVRKAS